MTALAKVLLGAMLVIAWDHLARGEYLTLLGDAIVIGLAAWAAVPERTPMRTLTDVVADGFWPTFNDQMRWLATADTHPRPVHKIAPVWCTCRYAHPPHTWMSAAGVGNVCAGVKGKGRSDVHDQALG